MDLELLRVRMERLNWLLASRAERIDGPRFPPALRRSVRIWVIQMAQKSLLQRS